MAPDETTSDAEPINLGDHRLLIEAARRLARRRRRQDGVLAAAVVVVVLTLALATSGVFQRTSVQVGFTPVVVPGPVGAVCSPPAFVIVPRVRFGARERIVVRARSAAGGRVVCVTVPPAVVKRIHFWRVAG